MSLLLALVVSFSFHITGPQITFKGQKPVVLDSDFVLPATAGVPAIPTKVYFFAVDGNLKSFKIKHIQFENVPGKFNIPAVPPPAILSLKKPAKDHPDPAIYGKDAFYPKYPVIFRGIHTLLGQKVASLIFYPYRYNPVKRKLQIVKSVDIEIETTPAKTSIKKSRITASMIKDAISSLVSNSEDVSLSIDTIQNGIDYLIVTNTDMSNAFDSLARWYRKLGFETEVRTVEWIGAHYSGRDLAEKIRNYLKVCNQDSGLTFVLLGGDVVQVPARVAYAMTSGAGYVSDEDSIRADLYYSDLDGTWDANNNGTFGEIADSVDLYPDVFVGRAPVRNAEEAMTFVRKVIAYENPAPQYRDYQNKVLFFAEVLWNDPFTDEGVAKDMIDSLYIPPGQNITKLYETRGNENSAAVENSINAGVNLLNHDGHGWYTVMGTGPDVIRTSDIDNLTNGLRLGILYSIGCWVGAFDRDAISEHFIRNPHGGGVAFIGNSRYGWGSPGNPGYGYSDKFDEMFYRVLFWYNEFRAGMALAFDKVLFIPLSRDENVYRWHQYQLNLLGDPAMPIWTEIPREISAEIPDTVIQGSELRISFENILKGHVYLIQGDSVVERGLIHYGNIILHIPSDISGPLTLTVFRRSFVPLIKRIYVQPNGYNLIADTILVRDTGAYPDSLLSPGESGILKVVIKNSGNATSPPAQVSLASTDTFLHVSADTINLPSLSPSGSDTLNFLYSVDSCRPHISSLILRIGSDTSFLRLLITRPVLKAGYVTENIVPGDTNNVIILLGNNSPSPARDVMIRINSSNPGVRVLNDSLSFEEILRGVVFTLPLYVDSSVPIGERFTLMFSYRASGYVDSCAIDGVVGNSSYHEGFESSLEGWTLGNHWSVVERRHLGGQKSLYCGDPASWSYGNNWTTQAISPPIVLAYHPILSFGLWYSVATYGSDGIYIEVSHDGIVDTLDFLGSGGALDSLTSFVNSWAVYRYPLRFLHAGDTVRVIFKFVSDEQDTAEGFYLDDFSITGYTLNPLDVHEGMTKKTFEIFYIPGGFEVIPLVDSRELLKVYDVTGRVVRTGLINGRGIYKVRDLKAGVYFVRIGKTVKRIAVLK